MKESSQTAENQGFYGYENGGGFLNTAQCGSLGGSSNGPDSAEETIRTEQGWIGGGSLRFFCGHESFEERSESDAAGSRRRLNQPIKALATGNWICDSILQIHNCWNIRQRRPGIWIGEIGCGLQADILRRERP